MKKNEVNYFYSKTYEIEIIYCRNSEISYPEHNHISNYTIGLVLEGSIQLKRNNTIIECREDEYFIIPPYEPHAVKPVCGKYSMLTICIGKDFVKEYDSKSALPIFQGLAEFLLIKNMINTEHIKTSSNIINILFQSIVSAEESIDEAIMASRNFLENYTENLVNIEKLSQKMFVSKYHFIREFKKNVGLPPYRFQMQNRIRKAQHLLAINSNFTEVALATGFYDQSHFIKSFKKIVGVTPSGYLVAISEFPTSDFNKGQERTLQTETIRLSQHSPHVAHLQEKLK